MLNAYSKIKFLELEIIQANVIVECIFTNKLGRVLSSQKPSNDKTCNTLTFTPPHPPPPPHTHTHTKRFNFGDKILLRGKECNTPTFTPPPPTHTQKKKRRVRFLDPHVTPPTYPFILNHTSSQISLSLLIGCPSSFTIKTQTQTHKSLHLSLSRISPPSWSLG